MEPFFVKNRAAVIYVGQRVREFRRLAGLSQTDLARRVFGVAHHVPVSHIERGERQVSAVELWRIARVLDRSLDEFFPAPLRSLPKGLRLFAVWIAVDVIEDSARWYFRSSAWPPWLVDTLLELLPTAIPRRREGGGWAIADDDVGDVIFDSPWTFILGG